MSNEKVSGFFFREDGLLGIYHGSMLSSANPVGIEVLLLLANYDGCQRGDAKAVLTDPICGKSVMQ
jgi:hypothetical protein